MTFASASRVPCLQSGPPILAPVRGLAYAALGIVKDRNRAAAGVYGFPCRLAALDSP
jgi:hypothetical protein